VASRARSLLLGASLAALLLVVFVVTVWILMAVLEDGALPGGPRVAVVEIEGIILDGDHVVRELLDYAENPAVKAVVVRVNSPGGVVAPTQEIYSAVQRVRKAGKPVVASFGAVAASGGYYVGAATNRIFANPGTLTGSIGVVMQMANVEGLLKKVGVEYVVVKAGAYKDVGNFARTMTPEERRILQALLDDVHGQFIAAVAQGRGLEESAVRAVADGRIYSGARAKSLKLVDELGGFEEAVEAAGKLGGIPGKPKLILPRKRFSFTDLLKSELGIGVPSTLLPSLPTLRTPLYLMY
jgi:protease IV